MLRGKDVHLLKEVELNVSLRMSESAADEPYLSLISFIRSTRVLINNRYLPSHTVQTQ
jgi:hypothetical protein